jgi:hypothetical protein
VEPLLADRVSGFGTRSVTGVSESGGLEARGKVNSLLANARQSGEVGCATRIAKPSGDRVAGYHTGPGSSSLKGGLQKSAGHIFGRYEPGLACSELGGAST